MIISTTPTNKKRYNAVTGLMDNRTQVQTGKVASSDPENTKPPPINQRLADGAETPKESIKRSKQGNEHLRTALKNLPERQYAPASKRELIGPSSPPPFRLNPRYQDSKSNEKQIGSIPRNFRCSEDMQEIQPIHRGDRKPSPTHQQHRTESWYSLSVGGTGTESWRRHFRTSSNEISNAEMNTGMRRQADHREMITNAYESRRVTHYQANRKIPDEPTRIRHSSHDSGQSKPWTRNERESNQRTVWEKVSHRNNSLPCSTIRTVPVARYNSSELHQSAVLHRPHRKPDSAHSGKRTHKDPDSVPIGSHYHKLRGDGETVVVPYRPSTGTFEVTSQFKAASSTVNTGWIEPSSEKKRAKSPTLIHYHQLPSLTYKKARGFDKLDLLCSATLEIGEMYDNPTGCSCPKSRCVALYCDCFKAGRRCNPDKCKCVDCKNTVIESGADGARTKAIRCILARNPRAFTTAGHGNPILKLQPGEIACNCVRSRCLKLYCSCFQHGRACNASCTCVGCYNTQSDDDGYRTNAMQQYLEKCPTTFTVKKTKEVGLGCACKNNRCIRKYCECFRSNLKCTAKCSCRQCANGKHDGVNTSNSTSVGGSLDVTALYPDDDVHEVHKI